MNKYFKYSRTYHFPWSKGTTSDDRILASIEHFSGKEVVVTEKVDGENTSLYCDHLHARSLDSKHHESRNWIKTEHARLRYDIPKGWRICGENMFAKHSIHYHALQNYFLVFGIYNAENECLSWDETVEFCELLGLTTVPVLYRGLWNEEKIKQCWTGNSAASPGDEQEGYVCRVVDAFPYDKQDEEIFSKYTAKFVREKHVKTSQHWLAETIVPNLLRANHAD